MLYIFDTGLDLSLVAGHVRFGRNEYEAVMSGKLHHLRVELGIEPVRVLNRRLQVIDDQDLWNPAKRQEGIFQNPYEVLGCLPEDRFTVASA